MSSQNPGDSSQSGGRIDPEPETAEDLWLGVSAKMHSVGSDAPMKSLKEGGIALPAFPGVALNKSTPGCFDDLDVESLTGEKALSSLEADLFGHTYSAHEDTFTCPPLSAKDRLDIERLIDSCGLYDRDHGRWSGLPEDLATDCFLPETFLRIFDAVLREGMAPDDQSVLCLPRETRRFNALPALAIFSSSPSLDPHAIPSYRSCLTPIEVKSEKDCWLASDILQSAIYAKQCFIQQHSRIAVPCLLLTEKRLQVFLFDRNGVVFSSALDIHHNALAFVYLILQTSHLIGFDPTVFWKDGVRYVAPGYSPCLEIIGDSPSYISSKLVGKGATCWKAMDEDRRIYFVKSFFAHACPEHTDFEWKLYRDTDGLPGVGRMFGHAASIFSSGVKGKKSVNHPWFLYPQLNRRCYLILECYERSILEFNDRIELLCAFRDAIAGHENLWNARIWHRNIRPGNVRIGDPGGPVGYRGVLVGFDEAKRIGPNPFVFSYPNYLIGDNTFKSMSLLKSTTTLIHTDYLDDLESFFYILCYICSSYQGPHCPVDEKPLCIVNWDSDDPDCSARAKHHFVNNIWHYESDDLIKPYFGEIFTNLVLNLRNFLVSSLQVRLNVFNAVPQFRPPPRDVYEQILEFFDNAIADQTLEEGSELGHADDALFDVGSPAGETPDTVIGSDIVVK